MKLLIYGAGGLGKEMYDLIMRSMPDRWEKIYFIDDFADEASCYLSESIKFSSITQLFGDCIEDVEGIVAVGEPAHRELLIGKLESAGIRLATIIDKTAIISPTAKIGEGTIVCEMATIHADVAIGRGVLVQPFCAIGHDTQIGDYSVMGSYSALGGATIFGKKVYIGMNATLKEKLIIGDDAIVSMGAVVYKDVEPGITVIGNPARVTRGNDEHRVFK